MADGFRVLWWTPSQSPRVAEEGAGSPRAAGYVASVPSLVPPSGAMQRYAGRTSLSGVKVIEE